MLVAMVTRPSRGLRLEPARDVKLLVMRIEGNKGISLRKLKKNDATIKCFYAIQTQLPHLKTHGG